MNGTIKRQQGFSIIELMVSLTVGLLVMAGVISLFVSTLAGNRNLLESARLDHELNTIVLMMSDDIRRAGYWGDEALDADWSNGDRNPFTNDDNYPVAVSSATGSAANSCILYTYNLDRDTTDDTDADDARIGYCAGCSPSAPYNAAPYDTDNLEMFGYRLVGGAVQMRTSGVTTASSFTCNNDTGTWEDISNNDVITVTNLNFDLDTTNVASLTVTDNLGNDTDLDIESWDVTILIEGQLANDPNVVKSLTTTVTLANEVVKEAP